MSKDSELAGSSKNKIAEINKKYLYIAENIVDGLLYLGIIIASKELGDKKKKMGFFPIHEILDNKVQFKPLTYRDLMNAISTAISRNLTYGNLGTLTLRNNKGKIVAKLYIMPDGTLADDSWVKNEGW